MTRFSRLRWITLAVIPVTLSACAPSCSSSETQLRFGLSSTAGSSARTALATSISGNRYSITPDNYVVLVKSIRLLKCTDSSGALTPCQPGPEGEDETISSTTIYESGGVPIYMTESAADFEEALDLDSLAGEYNGIQFQLGYIQQRFPIGDIDGDGRREVERNLEGRSYRICTSPAEADLCDNSDTEASRGDYLIEDTARSDVFAYPYFTGCTGSSGSTLCTGFSTHAERPDDFGALDPNFRDEAIGGSHEWIDGYFSPLAGMDTIDAGALTGKTIAISFDISDSFQWHDHAMVKSTCTESSTATGEFGCTFYGADPETDVTDSANLNPGSYDLLDDYAFLPNVPRITVEVTDESTARDASLSALPGFSERLYVGTGEFSPTDDWSAILRFDEAETISCTDATGGVPSDGTLPVKSLQDANDVRLNFAHSIAVDEVNDEMYLASLFTTHDNHNCDTDPPGGEICGSVGVISGASGVDGSTTLSRHIYGGNTTINTPHGIWVDTTRDILYVASTFNDQIVTFEPASTADGDIAPARTISTDHDCAPVFVYVDEGNDRMFVACMTSHAVDHEDSGPPSIWIYNNASTISDQDDGTIPNPDIKIEGNNTRLSEGNNQTTHNVWYDPNNSLLIVGHHTNEILIYDLTSLNWNPTVTPDIQDLTPRVLKINDESDDSDQFKWSAYGLFYLASLDRLYVSAGYAETGDSNGSNGPPTPGTPMNAIKVFDGISDPGMSGVQPNRQIWWASGDQYYPPQALWVTLY